MTTLHLNATGNGTEFLECPQVKLRLHARPKKLGKDAFTRATQNAQNRNPINLLRLPFLLDWAAKFARNC
jgi:hypothetical protein